MDNIFYVYTHTRCDTGKVFYVGISRHNFKLFKYRRAYIKSRHKEWKAVANVIQYTVDIVLDNVSQKDAYLKEIELISFYGRTKFEGGTLVNISKGGGNSSEGFKMSDSAKKKLSEHWAGVKKDKAVVERIKIANTGKKRSDEVRLAMSISRKGRYYRSSSPTAKKVINTVTGKVFDCAKDAADSIGLAHSTFYAKLIGKWKVNDTNFIYANHPPHATT